MNRLYYISFKLNDDQKNFEEIKKKHLDYLIIRHKQIFYGGVLKCNGKRNGVVYIVIAESLNQATQFYKNDPYSEIATSYEIYEFEQKIPNL